MGGLNYVSFICISVLLYVVIILVVECPSYYSQYSQIYPVQYVKVGWFNVDSAAIAFFAYNCHHGLFPIYSELFSPNRRRIKKVAWRSIIFVGLFYLLVAVSGYLSTLDETNDVVINRPPLTGNSYDLIMEIGRLALWLTLIRPHRALKLFMLSPH